MLVGITNVQASPACEYAQNTRLNTTRRGMSVLRASLGQQAPRGSPGCASSRMDSSGALGSQRRRVAAVVADAPPIAKEDKDYLLELETQKELLQMAYLAEIDPTLDALLEVEEGIAELDNVAEVDEELEHVEEVVRRASERRRSSLGTSTSKASKEEEDGVAFDNVTVPSTRTRRAKKEITRSEGEATSKPPVRSLETIASIGAMEDSHLFDGDELAQDAAFMAQLRTFLRNSRRAKRTSKRPSALTGRVTASVVSSFLTSLGNTPVLAGRHEQRLSRVIARGNSVKTAAAALARSTGRMPSLADVAAAAGLSSAQDAARAVVLADVARGLMVDFNIRMVVHIAKRYIGNGVELSDLIPEGMIGLRRAIEKFDASKGFKFSTYAHWWIRQSITRAISDQSRDVRLPVHIVEFLMKLSKTRETLRDAQPGRAMPPTHAEIAAAMGVPLSRVMSILRASRAPKTPEDLSAPNFTGSSSSSRGLGGVADTTDAWCEEDEPPTDFVREGERAEFLRETVTLMLSTLAVRDRNVLKLRYGLHPSETLDSLLAEHGENLPGMEGEDIEDDLTMGLGLLAVGKKYQLSRERIRQIENKALEHLRKEWRKNLAHDVKEGKQLPPSARDALYHAIAKAQY